MHLCLYSCIYICTRMHVCVCMCVYVCMYRPVAGGGGGRTTPPPVAHPQEFVPPFSNFVPPFSNFVPPFSKPMQSVRDRDRPITPPPLGLRMWMTSHGQCPRGVVLVNVQEGGVQFFGGQMTSRGQWPVNVQEWGRFSN